MTTETTMLAWIGAIAPTIAALGGIVIGVLNARKSTAIAEKAEAISGKADELHKQGNANQERSEGKLAEANARIAALEKLVGQLTPDAAAKALAELQARGPAATQSPAS